VVVPNDVGATPQAKDWSISWIRSLRRCNSGLAMDAYGLFIYPFLGCVVLILIHAYFGIHVLERGIIFVDLSLAQFISLGTAIALFLGKEIHDKYIYSAVFAVVGALILSFRDASRSSSTLRHS